MHYTLLNRDPSRPIKVMDDASEESRTDDSMDTK